MRVELKALRSYALPRYPTWTLVEAEPALLARAIPRRWEGRAKVAAALAAAVFGLGGAGALVGAAAEKSATPTPPPPSPTPKAKATPVATAKPAATAKPDASPKPVATAKPAATGQPAATAAPRIRPPAVTFGTAGTTDIPYNRGDYLSPTYFAPVIFLNEADARQIINEELAQTGLKLAEDVETIPGALQQRGYVKRYDRDKDQEVYVLEETKDPPTDLVLDGWDAGKKIGYEYLSAEEQAAAGGVGYKGSQAVAEYLARRLNAQGGERTVAVFWAPSSSPDVQQFPDDRQKAEAAAAERVKGDLRQQVRDFAAWLKAQGILQ